MSDPTLSASSQRVEKIALELVFASPGKDDGLLPINSLVAEIETATKDGPVPPPLAAALAAARQSVEAALDAGGFTADSLERLGLWAAWMRTALAAFEQERPLPEIPEELTAPTPAGNGPNPADTGTPNPDHPASGQEQALLLDLARDGDLLREFLAESEEHLNTIEQGVLTLEKCPTDADTLHSIFRAFHTFKGGSGFLNLKPIHTLAHDLESLLDLARQGKMEIDATVIDIILVGADTLRRFVEEIRIQLNGAALPTPISLPTLPLIERIRRHINRGTLPSTNDTAGQASAAPSPSTSPAPQGTASPQVTSGGDAPTRPNHRSGAGFVKVDTQKLDGLVDLVGELVIAQSLVAHDPDLQTSQTPQLARHLTQLGRLTAELQRTAMSLRMVRIQATFEKMKRLVRDLSIKAGKQVELVFSGEETELDRNLIEKLEDPLVHMMRNAVDHGVESPEKRIAANKSPNGTIQLRAFHRGGNIVIEIKDDGSGISRDRILAKARKQGLLREDESPSDQEVFALIFAPGFSTAEKVTEISGRGVGLDVVRRNISSLRGKIEIASTPGLGATFTISLPLTLAIIDGLIVGVGDQRFILPTLAVRESFRPTAAMISTVQRRGELVNVRNRQCPMLRLHRYLGIEPASEDPTQSIVVVLESDQESRCLLVDQLLGKQEVVIKSLGESFKPCHAIAGAAILGDGRVGLILDVNDLLHPESSHRNGREDSPQEAGFDLALAH
jgi:two-component system chemotaxis sensor kinase CheA